MRRASRGFLNYHMSAVRKDPPQAIGKREGYVHSSNDHEDHIPARLPKKSKGKKIGPEVPGPAYNSSRRSTLIVHHASHQTPPPNLRYRPNCEPEFWGFRLGSNGVIKDRDDVSDTICDTHKSYVQNPSLSK